MFLTMLLKNTFGKNDVDLIIIILMAIKLKTKVALGRHFLFATADIGGCSQFFLFQPYYRRIKANCKKQL